MRFEHLEAIAFGPLREQSFDLDSDVVLVFGPNEAGKSSFRAALETVLYGFRPAERDAHPLARWGGGDAANLHLEAHVRLDTDEVHGVERLLLASGKSRVSPGRSAFAGPRRGNTGLPWVSWLSRDVFAALYSLELSQLAALDPSVREDVDALLLPAPSGLPLRAIGDVRAELRRRQNELWRADNRGKPRARELRSQLAKARAAAADAQKAERALRDARAERAEREQRLAELRAKKRALDALHAEAPLLGELFETRRRRAALGPPPDLSALGDLELVKPSALTAEIAEIEERLRAPAARLEQPPLTLADRHAAALDAASEIEHAIAQRAVWDADRERLDEQRDASRRARQRALDEIGPALVGAPGDDVLQRVAEVPVSALEAIAARWAQRRDADAAEAASAVRRWRGLALACGVLGGGAALAGSLDALAPALALPFALDPRVVPGGALLLLASLLASLWIRPRARAAGPAAPDELADLLAGLDVAEPLVASPSGLQTLTARLVDANRADAQAREAERAAGALERTLREREHGWGALCARLGIDAGGPPPLRLERLRALLDEARRAAARVDADRGERELASRAVERDAPLRARKRDHASRLAEVLRTTAGDEHAELDALYERVVERRREEDFLRRREHDLRADPRTTRLENDPRARADRPADGAPWLPEIRAAREREIESVQSAIDAESHRLGELAQRLADDPGSAFARATDRVRETEAELAEVERERDRLALLEAIVARADREFRDANQPDVLRRASAYLDRITLGRYPRIDLRDGDDGQLCVTPAGASEPVAVGPPLSQGTLDQIFLCLRLGLLDHLDEDRERLPLVLDDALLRMDDRRRRATYAVLGEIAPARQVLLLTCHAAVADEVERALKVRRINL